MRKKIMYVFLFFGILLIASFIIAGIKYQPESEEELKKTSLRLKWIDQAQFAGFYVAKKHGLYSEKGLDVEIYPGGPDISPVQMVVTGVNDFGITGADQIILAREKGIRLVALAVLYKDSPVTIMSLAEKEIKTPKDLEGKKVAVVYGRDEEVIYRALLSKMEVDSSKISEVPSMASPMEVLEQVDARVGYELNGGILLPLEGYEINMIKPRDYGIRFYADTLFTTEEMIEKNPELVRNFVLATLEGWELAIENPELAVEEAMQINSSLNREHQFKFLEQSVPLIVGKGEIGYSEKEIWEQMQEILLTQGLIQKTIDLDQAFTNEFLK